MRRLAAWLAAAGLACTAAEPPPPAVLDAVFPDGRTTETFASLSARAPLEPGQTFRAVEVGRDARSSHHVVTIRDAEAPHRHDHHDLLVVMLAGHGTMRLGAQVRAVGEGSILWVPRGTPHAFRNASAAPAKAYAVYFPPFDGEDRIPAE